MSLPQASQAQINAMQKAAQEKFPEEPVVEEQHAVQEEPAEENIEEVQQEVSHTEPEEEETRASASSKEENLRILRERSERAERERDQLLRQLEQLNSSSSGAKEATRQEIKSSLEDLNFDPDDLADGKQLQVLANELRALKRQLQDSQQQTQLTTTELRLKRDFPDFEEVVSYENQVKLREMDPDLAESIIQNKDPYKQHALAYRMIKNLGIHKPDHYKKERAIAQTNASKPRPATSISPQEGDSPLSRANAFANGLTPELKAQLRREMEEAKRNN